MPKLKQLITGQDIAFDTHQAGDGQKMNVKALHLEKRLHEGGGKLRFPLFGDMSQPDTSSNVNEKTKERIIKEVKGVLKKNPTLRGELAQTIFDELERFSSEKATLKDAEETARNIARYFDLDKNFIDIISDLKRDKLMRFTTFHKSLSRPKEIFQITQSKHKITIVYVNEDWIDIKKKHLSTRKPYK